MQIETCKDLKLLKKMKDAVGNQIKRVLGGEERANLDELQIEHLKISLRIEELGVKYDTD